MPTLLLCRMFSHRTRGAAQQPAEQRLQALCVGALLFATLALLARSSTAWRAAGGQAARFNERELAAAGEVAGRGACAPLERERASLAAAALPRCELLEMVCLEEGAFVMHHPSYLPGAGAAARALPRLSSGASYYSHAQTWARAGSEEALAEDGGQGEEDAGPAAHRALLIPDPAFRARSAEEAARPSTASPAFSNCTVPLVLYPIWLGSYFHAFSGGRTCGVAVGLAGELLPGLVRGLLPGLARGLLPGPAPRLAGACAHPCRPGLVGECGAGAGSVGAAGQASGGDAGGRRAAATRLAAAGAAVALQRGHPGGLEQQAGCRGGWVGGRGEGAGLEGRAWWCQLP